MNLEAMNPERLESLHTIGEVKDPPGTSFYTPADPPTHRVRRVDKGQNTVTEDAYYQDKTGMSFLKLFGCLQYQLVNNILSTNHLLLFFITFLLKTCKHDN